MKFIMRDKDSNAAAIVYAADESHALKEYFDANPMPDDDALATTVEDITETPTIGSVGVHDREIGG